MSQRTKKAKSVTFKFSFNGLTVEHFDFTKEETEFNKFEDELRMELIATSLFKKSSDEVIIKIKYSLVFRKQILTTITTKNHFLIQNIAKYLNQDNNPTNKSFEGLIEYLSYHSVQHTRGVHTYLADKENSIFKKYSIPVYSMNEMKKLSSEKELVESRS